MITVESCPPELAHLEQPEYGGNLFFHEETGIAGCPECGWSGAPTVLDGYASTWCPICDHEPDTEPQKVPRNQLCPCESGKKAKKCDCEIFCV